MADILHVLDIQAPHPKVYWALTSLEGLRGWWTTDTNGTPEKGGELRFAFGNENYNTMEVVSMQENKYVEWLVTGSSFVKGEQWIGTHIVFTLAGEGTMTHLTFEQKGWKDQTEFFGTCNYTWGLFMHSLKSFCESGIGSPENPPK